MAMDEVAFRAAGCRTVLQNVHLEVLNGHLVRVRVRVDRLGLGLGLGSELE